MKRALRIIYMGTPEFAVPGLETLHRHGFNIVAVITAPDKPSGRGLKLKTSPVKQKAEALGIPILQPTKLKSPAFLDELKSYDANLQVVVAFRMLPEVVWSMPAYGTFNLHASLLPQYRGAAPIHWAIINGEKETGLTTFMLKHEIDTGDLLFQEKEPIHDADTVGDLYERLMQKGARLILKTVQAIADDDCTLKPQPSSEGVLKKAPKIFKEDCAIDFDRPTQEVNNFIRGLSPFPAAHTNINGKNCKIYRAEIPREFPQSDKPIVTDNKSCLLIKTADGYISIRELQMQGKKRMGIENFLRGNAIEG